MKPASPWRTETMIPAHSMRFKVMLADDDPCVAQTLDGYLRNAGYSVVHCYSGQEVMEKAAHSRPDLILMDVLLGDADGKELCKRLRADKPTRQIPIILISAARAERDDIVAGLGQADDYLVKPLEPRVLIAKIGALLRRIHAPERMEEVLRRHKLELSVQERKVRLDSREVRLTRKEFDLLTALLRNDGKVASHRYLLETVWGYEPEDYNDPSTVQVHVCRLKKKLGKTFASRIENVLGVGYRVS